MDQEKIKKEGERFTVDGTVFYDLAVGPKNRRAVYVMSGVLHKHYGFSWFYNPDTRKREEAAHTLLAQFQYALIDHRAKLLPLGKLTNTGDELKCVPGQVLDNALNDHCSMRDYA